MKLIIQDESQLNSYDLPSSQDSFIINYKNEILNLKNTQGKWILAANKNIELTCNGLEVSQTILDDYQICHATLKTINKKVQILGIPSTEKYTACSLEGITTLTIGLSSQCNISYSEGMMKDPYATIQVGNGTSSIKSEEGALVYVNEDKVTNAQLSLGDVIFINGLKIIWMDTFIKINNPQGKVHFNGIQSSNLSFSDVTSYTKTTESERTIKLYDESKLFFHTPKQRTYIKEEVFDIERPPNKENSENLPIIFSLGTSMVVAASAGMTGFDAIKQLNDPNIDAISAILNLIFAGLMIVSCVFMPMLLDMYQKNKAKKREDLRQHKYREYLENKNKEIETVIRNQESILNEKHLSLESITKQMLNQGYSFWSREIIDPDFLTIRLGIGNLPASIKINASTDGFTLEEDNLKDMVNKLISQKRELVNVPISISLLENKVTPVVIETNKFYDYINTIMIQLLFYYSSMDLKIVVITKEDNKDKWDYIKYTTHNWSVDRNKRLFAANETDINQLSMYLEQLYTQRMNSMTIEDTNGNNNKEYKEYYQRFNEYYLIITDDFSSIKNVPFIDKIINNKNLGFSLLIFSDSMKNVPSRLDKFVVIRDSVSGIFDKNVIDGTNIGFKADYLNEPSIRKYANYVANIPIASHDIASDIPTSISFLELYKVGMIEHLNITTRWQKNDPTTSLNAILGLQSNNRLIGLDLHEKVHGPHGLIAGSTGSGKSEFIITLILSLAINYHPYEVQFVLIDYKGGGLAGAFEKREKGIKIPHLVGTITNLDKSEMNRTLVSIKSELERRQIKFNEAREALGESTIDIYKYQRMYREGKVTEPMSHLIIICDEFAELKAQQPDFMDELVSTARIGRSLGVHLILATQKPNGVVNDQIWSNSRFKVCLKVQTSEDSFEIIKRDDASRIKETGRFYLQVGNDELFEYGQSAWTGEKYIPKDVIYEKVDDTIEFINDDGTIIKTMSDIDNVQTGIDKGEQLSNIVDYLYRIAVTNNLKFSNLWLPPIPENIFLGNLIAKYKYKANPFEFRPIIGEYDKPYKQEQGLYDLSINNSNTIVFGSPGSGKELLTTSFIYSLCISHSPYELNVNILDFGGEVLRPFERMPQVGNYISIDEPNKVHSLFLFLEKQIKYRKELFSEYRGSFDTYNMKSENKVPLILNVVNAYESFYETCENYDDYLIHLLREGSKYGIVFLITVISTRNFRQSALEFFDNKIMLKTQDIFDYQYILNTPSGFVPSDLYGRGLCVYNGYPCEFQTAHINVKDEVNDTIKETSNKLIDVYKIKAKGIKVMPKTSTFKDLARSVKNINAIPMGYEIETADLTTYNFTARKINTIFGEKLLDNVSFYGTLIDLLDKIDNIKINLFDIESNIDYEGKAKYYNSDYIMPLNEIMTNNATTPVINMVIGLSGVIKAFSEEEYQLFKKILLNANSLNNQYFILLDDVDKYESIEDEELLSVIDKNNGIFFGNDLDLQDIYTINNISQVDIESRIIHKTYIINNNQAITLKGIGVSEDDN